jgi:hypothetical protein
MTLETITSKHRNFQQVSIHVPPDLAFIAARNRATVEGQVEEANPAMRWSDLDRLLVKLWELRATRTRVVYSQSEPSDGARGAKDWVVYLLPELTKRGFGDLVEAPYVYEYDD